MKQFFLLMIGHLFRYDLYRESHVN